MTSGLDVIRDLPLWQKITWSLIVIYLLTVLYVYWVIGWSNLAFPL